MANHDSPQENLWIDGERVPSRSGRYEPVLNPATGEEIARVAEGGPEDIGAAVAAARRSFEQGEWRRATSSERARVLLRLAEKIRAAAAELASLESRNVGKPIQEARGEIEMGASCFQYYAGLIPAFGGQTVPVGAPGIGLTFREPVGVCGLIVPWNFPFAITTWKVAPALALGNSVVVKPASATPLTALRLAELALEAGLPEHLFQVLPGAGPVAGAALVEHPGVAKIVFTGSTAVGRQVMARCAPQVKRVTLELGGKSPNIVFADADLERAAAAAPMSFLDNTGQDCCARTRILVERSVHDRFLELLEPAVLAVTAGDPLDPGTDMGPLISAAHRERVRSYVPEDAPAAIRGTAPAGKGYWYPATVLAGIDPDAPAATEEVFGPVAVVLPFDDEADAIRLANATPYGLAGSVWTRDAGRALRVPRAVQAGNLSVNSHSAVRYWTPFGGFKRSGIGRELGPDALTAFTETKNVFISTEEN